MTRTMIPGLAALGGIRKCLHTVTSFSRRVHAAYLPGVDAGAKLCHCAIISSFYLGLVLAVGDVAWAQAASKEPTVLDTHPTVQEFREEIGQADLVVRAKIVEVLRRRELPHADQDAVVEILRTYKGKLPLERPCVRMIIYQSPEHRPGTRLANVGEEVILPIEIVHPYTGTPPPNGQALHYVTSFYYAIAEDGTVTSPFGLPPEMQAYAKLDRLERLILDTVKSPPRKPAQYKLGEVLFADDFDDGSLAGWTFLEGSRGLKDAPLNAFTVAGMPPLDVIWVGPNSILENEFGLESEPPTSRPRRDPKTGLYRAQRSQTVVEFGVIDGRLRLRSSHVWQHITAVTGDPQWTDYQIDVDMFNLNDKEMPHARANYLKFGPYGRVDVPNFPETQGEHSFVAVEFGNFANYGVSLGTWDNSAFQIRCSYPERPPVVWRDHSRLLRQTKILDYQPWPIPQDTKIHLAARFMGNRVEGWIDGKQILQGVIPRDHPGATKGRIALWVFETWADFDNVKVTRLVPVKE